MFSWCSPPHTSPLIPIFIPTSIYYSILAYPHLFSSRRLPLVFASPVMALPPSTFYASLDYSDPPSDEDLYGRLSLLCFPRNWITHRPLTQTANLLRHYVWSQPNERVLSFFTGLSLLADRFYRHYYAFRSTQRSAAPTNQPYEPFLVGGESVATEEAIARPTNL